MSLHLRSSLLPAGSREAALKLAFFYSYLVKVTDDLCAAKPRGPFQGPILFAPPASSDAAHPSLILETFSSFPFGFWDATVLVLPYFADHSSVPSAGPASSPHPLSVGGPPRTRPIYTPSLGDLIQPPGLSISSVDC